jgi:hypothetical protein
MLRSALFAFILVVFYSPVSAYAYLDPGAGSIMLQGLAACLLFLGVFWRRIVRFVKTLFSKHDQNEG